ncbi:uncharacterized protein LOC107884157 [Acyrthosiphon pisum]|uniref:Uncharacterized protein n=1 Tax=Acyrthosiphon pisum TaxID=7029 RepID=A0A8R2H5U8_ACYPI|nr:uncharacterized protein LOC107884157 [Acyrthosiphon pisum]|eukprot:XP_016661186.1 PREDICTED: uncharacterized protein LOC107884157 [Acyrthosiphon pisum]
MNKYTMNLLVFLLITGPGLILSVHAALCDPSIAPCHLGSCMPCNLGKKQPVKQDDCTNPNGCPEVTIVKIEPPASEFKFIPQSPFIKPPTTCIFCFWNMNGFFWYYNK